MSSQLASQGEISTKILPCIHVEWKVLNIHFLPQDTDLQIWSPSFHFKDVVWNLRLIRKRISYDCIDLYLVKNDPVSSAFRVNYRIGIKSVDGNRYRSHCGVMAYPSTIGYCGTSHPICRLELSAENTSLALNGVVRFYCIFWVKSDESLRALLTTDLFDDEMRTIGEISTEISTVLYVEWKFQGIHLLSSDPKHRIRSSSFQFKDETWYLQATMRNIEVNERGAYVPINLHLGRKECTTPTLNVDCKIGIKLYDRSTYWRHQDIVIFDRNADCHEFTICLNRLDEKIYQAPNGAVTFCCCLRVESAGNLDAVPTAKMSEDYNGSKSFTFTSVPKTTTTTTTTTAAAAASTAAAATTTTTTTTTSNPGGKSTSKSALSPPCPPGFNYGQQKWSSPVDISAKQKRISRLFKDFRNLFISGEDSDLSIKVKDTEFRVHKIILRARSSVFHSMLSHDMVEKNSGTIDITDCEPEAFKIFLLYLYNGSVGNLSMDTVFGLYRAADKYDTEELKLKCTEFMVSKLSLDTVCDCIDHALLYNEEELLKTATDFFAKNFKNIILTVKWQSFLKKNTVAANELLIKASNLYVLKE